MRSGKRDLLGTVALSPWTPNVQIALPAPLSGCVADDSLLRLSGAQLYGVVVPSIRKQDVYLNATLHAGRSSDDAVAPDQGHKGATIDRRGYGGLIDRL